METCHTAYENACLPIMLQLWFTAKGTHQKPLNNKHLKWIIQSYNSDLVILEQRNQTSVPYHNSESIQRSTVLEPMILYLELGHSSGHSLHSIKSREKVRSCFFPTPIMLEKKQDITFSLPLIILNLLIWKDWLISIYTNNIKPVTYSEVCKVPFAVTDHNCFATLHCTIIALWLHLGQCKKVHSSIPWNELSWSRKQAYQNHNTV